MIQSLLVANRGEIACRVIRTARAMDIRTVAVYSDADAKALHVCQAHEAVHIGPSPPAESYLRGDRIIAAALEAGAEAIHPGYGFLSENADFAQAVIDAGLVWVGPRPDSIRAMGLKDAAKTLMQAAGVPVTPGYLGEDQSPERLRKEAASIGYPVLIKAVAGGGGKGMRKVDAAEDFLSALESCKREANSSFGNSYVLLEKWITSPRHIEVQVFGDTHGNVVHLFERDCSLQRRHQKVIEEAPAPGMDEVTRAAICGAAVRAAKAVDYVGAGTIEFIADASEGLSAERIFFMEMNTRLQVEHPVTEEITGVDLVEWQLRVASGEPLPKRQEELSINGWSMEARLYAEDPARGFMPSTGRLEFLHLENHVDWMRIETGVREDDEVSPFYDPIMAKIVVRAYTREEACERLANSLDRLGVWPVKTNAAFLYNLAKFEPFRAGAVDTGLIEAHSDELTKLPLIDPDTTGWWAEQLVSETEHFGFRLNAPKNTTAHFLVDGEPTNFRLRSTSNSRLKLTGAIIFADRGRTIRVTDWRVDGAGNATAADGAILAPMPGNVMAVDVIEGEVVTKGQRLLVLEAMKMEHALVAPFDGTVVELKAHAGAQVQVEALLARVARKEEA